MGGSISCEDDRDGDPTLSLSYEILQGTLEDEGRGLLHLIHEFCKSFISSEETHSPTDTSLLEEVARIVDVG